MRVMSCQNLSFRPLQLWMRPPMVGCNGYGTSVWTSYWSWGYEADYQEFCAIISYFALIYLYDFTFP